VRILLTSVAKEYFQPLPSGLWQCYRLIAGEKLTKHAYLWQRASDMTTHRQDL